MKIRNLAFVILSSTIAFSSVAAGDANYTTHKMQKPVIQQVDVNEVFQDQPTSAGETQSTSK